jgi:two-component system, NarL family, response regulator NreC
MNGTRSDRVIGVLVVDDRVIVREGLRAVLERDVGLAVAGVVADVAEAKRMDAPVDVVVVGIDLSRGSRADVVEELRRLFSRTPILVVTPTGESSTFPTVLGAGADGYVLEAADATDIIEGIRAVAGGETYLQPALGVQLARVPRRSETTPALSSHEEKLLGLLALGYTNAEVARLCEVSLRTVEARRARLRQTLGRHTRAELVEYARETGLV